MFPAYIYLRWEAIFVRLIILRYHRRMIKRIFSILTTCMVAFAIILAIGVIIVPKAMGGQSLVVRSGSMSPTFNVGDLIVVKPVAPEELSVGDIVTFATESEIITHRIVTLDYGPEGNMLITKGDDNRVKDRPIYHDQLRGRMEFRVPYVGYVSNFIGNHLAPTVGICVLILVTSLTLDAIEKRKRPQEA